MNKFLVEVFLMVFIILERWCLASSSDKCSCYTFHNNTKKSWEESNKDCKTRNGSLVSIETENEWSFMKEEIQIRTNVRDDEWYIGLKIVSRKIYQKTLEDRRNAAWTWTSGQPYINYHKWQPPSEPNGNSADLDRTYFCGVIAKEHPTGTYGHYKDVNCVISYPYICEYNPYNTLISSLSGSVCWDTHTQSSCAHSILTTTPKPSTTMPVTSQSSTESTEITQPSTSNSIATTTDMILATSTKDHQQTIPREGYPTDSPARGKSKHFSTVLVIVIILAVVLVVLICVFVAVFCRRKRKSGAYSERDERSTRTQLTNINQSPSSPNDAQLLEPNAAIYDEANNTRYAGNAHANTNNGITANPAYNVEQIYLSPVDGNEPPPPTPPIDYYSTIEESRMDKKRNATNNDISNGYEAPMNVKEPASKSSPQPVYAEVDKSKKTRGEKAGVGIATVEYHESEDASSTSPAVYAIVDKSKKRKDKNTPVGMATDDEAPSVPAIYAAIDNPDINQERTAGVAVATGSSKDDVIPTATPAVYAVVDKSKKSHRNKLGSVTEKEKNASTLTGKINNELKHETSDNQTYENTQCNSEHYEQLSTENRLYEGRRKPAENFDESGPDPLYSSVDTC